MNSKKITFFITLLVFSTTVFAQTATTHKVHWNGYMQANFSTNFNDVHSFALRRLKLWLFKKPDNNNPWGFRVQTTISSLHDQKFFLQDVEAYYVRNQIRIDIGQFVPAYSLQRFQPDFIIPLTDRSAAINYLIPNGKLGVRDIGVELNYLSKNKKLETWIGLFNGNGIKTYKLNNNGFLLTNKTQIHFLNHRLKAGYSFMYRKADNLSMIGILPNSVTFSGNDIRYNLFAQYQSKIFEIQAEYLYANLNGQIASGYYVLTTFSFSKNQFAASWNQYNDLLTSTSNAPTVHLGYNYLMNGNKLKIMIDNGFQINKGNISHYLSTVQFQLFFN